MKLFALPRIVIAVFALVCVMALSISAVAARTVAPAHAAGSVQHVQFLSSIDGKSEKISFTGDANTTYSVVVPLDSSPNRYKAVTGDNGDGTGNASTTVNGLKPGGRYSFTIVLDGGQPVSGTFSFTTNNAPAADVNVSTADNGQAVQINFRGIADTDYTVSIFLDLSPNPFNVHTDVNGNASVAVKALRSGATYTFSIKLAGQPQNSASYTFTTYQPSGNMQNVVATSASDGKSEQISFTGVAKTSYTIAIPFESLSQRNILTGDNGDGTGNALAKVDNLVAGATYPFTFQLDGKNVSDTYSFTTNKAS